MEIIIIFLIVIIGILFSLLLLYKKDIKSLKEDLRDINTKKLDNIKLRGISRDIDINNLISEINKTLEDKQSLNIDYINKEKEIKETIASISHDLRTPLTSIKGYVDLLLKRDLDEKEIEYLSIIKSRSGSLEGLVEDFYELSKLELKEYEYNLEKIDLEEVLTDTIALSYEKLISKNIEPIIEIVKGDYSIIGDRNAMERIINNILDNGIKYSNSFLKIKLKSDDKIRLNFINDTFDLKEEDIEKIFNRFFVMDTSRQSESTGLGLYITRKMLEDMGFRIQAKLEGKNINIGIEF